MKIYVKCRSLTLQRSLEIFLKEHLVSYKNAQIIISDSNIKTPKKLLKIGYKNAEIPKPFTKNSLLMAIDKQVISPPQDLDTQIANVVDEFAKNISKLLTAKIKANS